jgi:hypothetical protein
MDTLLCKCDSTLEIDFDVQTNEHFVECFECDYTNSNRSKEQLIRDCLQDGCFNGVV